MFLRMGSGDLSNSLFWFTVDKTQKMGEEKKFIVLDILSKNDQVAELHDSFTSNPILALYKVILILCDFSKY